jgi:hypothetical protein
VNIIYPRIAWKRLPAMLAITLLGAALAGVYGALHDQLSYSIAPEYFTKMKFQQFWYADFGWPQRVYASEVGFLASWWVGAIGAWLLARLGLDGFPPAVRRRYVAKAFAIVFGTAVIIGGAGLLLGTIVAHQSDLHDWKEFKDAFDLQDLPGFVIVAYLHAASYLGALLGVIAACVYVWLRGRRIANRASMQQATASDPNVRG